MTANWFPRRERALAALIALAVAACGGDPAITPPPLNDPSTAYWRLTLNVRAATMSTVAPYDTLQLVATPRTVDGSPITDLSAPTFKSLDLDRAQVDSNGLVHVIGSGDQVLVVASLEEHNVLHADTLVVNITEDPSPPVIATFTVHPDVGDSAKVALQSSVTLVPRAAAANGTPIPDVATFFSVSDPTIATIDRTLGTLRGIRPGQVSVYATTTTYGVARVDTLPYTIGNSILVFVTVFAAPAPNGQTNADFSPSTMVVGPGARVFFTNAQGPATDLTFDDPANVAQDDLYCSLDPVFCGGGNIAPWAGDPNDATGSSAIRIRLFPVPGVYNFHSQLFGTTGTITVVDEHTP